MSRTLEELKYYCNEDNPAGALLLTGEWGCGKTYLLNNDLKEELKDSHVLLRISLFGISSVEEIKTEVKRKWLYAFAESKNINKENAKKIEIVCGALKGLISNVKVKSSGLAKGIADGIFSINPLDLIRIDTKIGDMKVVLIFDDLERADLSSANLLGCINDYCENMGFNTIVVANEEKLQADYNDKEYKLSYKDVKEKIIKRIVHHIPDYKSIVNNVIGNMAFKSDKYEALLKECSPEILEIFSGETIDGKSLDDFVNLRTKGKTHKETEEENQRIRKLLRKRPHNIRSLKCALQDFERVHALLEKYEMPDINKWLYSFVSFTLACRAGLVQKSEDYEILLSENNSSKLYPGYYSEGFICEEIKAWVMDDNWDEKSINTKIEFTKEGYTAILPVEKARTHRIFELEEDDLKEGYAELLNRAYDGMLGLDDYVDLLKNSYWAGTFNINIPKIDWDTVYEGVQKKIANMLKSHTEITRYRSTISEENRSYYTDSQWKVYEAIKNYRDGNVQIYENNRNLYTELMKKDPYKAFEEIRNKRLDCFTEEMATSTLNAFKNALNAEKSYIIINSCGIIKTITNSNDFKPKETNKGIKALELGLNEYIEQCERENLSIAACHTKSFLKELGEIYIGSDLATDNKL